MTSGLKFIQSNKSRLFQFLIGLGLAFSQPSFVSVAENTPILIIFITIVFYALYQRYQLDFELFYIGIWLSMLATLFVLLGVQSKACLIPFGIFFASYVRTLSTKINLEIVTYTFLFLQIVVYVVHPYIGPLLPDRHYHVFWTYSGTFAEPGYLAISLALMSLLNRSLSYFLFSFLIILISGSFFGLLLMIVLGLRFLHIKFIFLGLLICSAVVLNSNLLEYLRAYQRLLILFQDIDLYRYAIIDQSTSYRFLTVWYNMLSMYNNGLFLPYNTLFPFNLGQYLSEFYGSYFFSGLKDAKQTASSMAGYGMQYGIFFILPIIYLIGKSTRNFIWYEKIVIFAIFILQSFALDLLFWFTLALAHETNVHNKDN